MRDVRAAARTLQRHLAALGLTHQQVVHVHAQVQGVVRVERVLRVYHGRRAAHLLQNAGPAAVKVKPRAAKTATSG